MELKVSFSYPSLAARPAAANGSGSSALRGGGGRGGKRARTKCSVTENLEALKMVEFCLRHERPVLYEHLSPACVHFLDDARRAQLHPPNDYEMLELPFVMAELRRGFRKAGIFLHPTIYGPYLLELS